MAKSDELKKSLPEIVYAPDQVQFCVEELQQYAIRLQAAKRGSEAKTAKPTELSVEGQALLTMLPASSRTDGDAIEVLCQNLETALQKNPQVEVVLAAPASPELKLELAGWFRNNANPNVLISFHLNPAIGGGLIVRTTNRIHDFSFRKLLMADPAKLTRILKNV